MSTPSNGRRLDEGVDEVVRELAMPDQRLAADHRQQRRDRRGSPDRPEPGERVLREEAQRRLERRPAEDVEGCEPAVVERFGDGERVAEAQPADEERLLPVAERRLHQFQTGHCGQF